MIELLLNDSIVKKLICCFAGLLMVANAGAYQENPHQNFSTKQNTTGHLLISWEGVDDVQKSCDRESHYRGFGGFNYAVEACSFWTKITCHVITAKQVNFHTLGHEIRHCFQGEFHGRKK